MQAAEHIATKIGASPAAAGPIDRKHLSRFTGGDRGLEQEILDLFAGQIPGTIEGLKAAQSEREWRLFAHTLKGSGRAVGAWKLADLAHQAEGFSATRDSSAVDEIIQAIEAAAADVEAYVRALRKDSVPA